MLFKNLLIASCALNQVIHAFSETENYPKIMGFENTSPDNTWVLKGTGDDIDYVVTHYNLELAPGAQEWLELPNNASKNFIYQVCDTSGQAAVLYVNGPGLMCAVYSGAMINITITSYGITAKVVKNTSIKTIAVLGDASPYMISATTMPPPKCNLPSPMLYDDQKWRIINLEGAALLVPQFPHACDLLYFANAGANTVRLPFKWDYLQNFVGQDIPIDWAIGGYGAQIIKLTDAWTSKGYNVILSMYDHMRYSYCAIGASDCWVSQERFAAAWNQIATQFANNSRVVFGLMNNPDVYDIIEKDNNGTVVVLNNQNAAARAIRSTGASQLILYSGNGGSKIENWKGTLYGASNRNTFTPENITDHHYAIETQMFYSGSEKSPEEGCIATAHDSPQSCVEMQSPENFIHWMQNTGIRAIISQTGGTNSSECIICINQGTSWAMMQENITGIGMWVGGHMWVNFNGDVENPLYLAPIHNYTQTQMTRGFQNVTNSKTGERFLTPPIFNMPTMKPTISSTHPHSKDTFLSPKFFLIYSAGTFIASVLLYLLYQYYHQKLNGSSNSNRWCSLWKSKKPSLLEEAFLKKKISRFDEMQNFV